MDATDYLRVDLDYDRPSFIFPELSSPEGNPMEYFRLAIDELRKNGFRREVKELDSLKYPKYEDSFDMIFRFLDFKNPESTTPYKEDNEYLYYKVKKDTSSTKQLDIFKVKTVEGIKELIEEGHDFSITNCYGRNHLHYLEDIDAIKELLKANEEHNWFSLIHLDVFNSTQLHGSRKPEVFTYLLNEMIKEDEITANMLLFGTNCFGKNAFGEILSVFSYWFHDKAPTESQIETVKDFLIVLSKVDEDKRDQFINLLDNLSGKMHDGKKYGTLILTDLLKEELQTNTTKTKRLKL